MGRPRGSKNSGRRAAPRSAYDTYLYWYNKYTKGHKVGWFRDRLNKDEFEQQYELAKRAGIKTNRARVIAMSQEYVDRKFEKQYKELYGRNLGDIRDKKARQDLFFDFVHDMQAQGMNYDQARDEFEKYFY